MIASVWKWELCVCVREGHLRKGAGSDRASTVEEVKKSVPTAAALIATIVKGRLSRGFQSNFFGVLFALLLSD